MLALDAKTGEPLSTFGHGGVVDLKLDNDQDLDLVTADIGLNATPLIAGDVDRRRRRAPLQRIAEDDEQRARVRARIRREDRQASLDLSHRAQAWRVSDTTRGSRRAPIATATPARGRSSAPTSISVSSTFRSRCRPATTTAATGRAIRCSTRVWSRSISRPASASGITRSTHHGVWDYDPPCAPVLYDVVVNGRRVRALAQPTKQAFLFVLNRETGEPIWPIEERAVPQSTVPNERTSPTQPFPTKPLPFDRQGVSVDDLIDFTPALRAQALEVIKKYTIGPLYTPPVAQQRRRPTRHDSAAGRYRRRQLAGRVIRSGNQPPLYSFAHGRLPGRHRSSQSRDV